ncbi:hypothetical protein LTR67_001198 [Exophiala xenobiotica]
MEEEHARTGTVVIAGAGPIGLLLATVLSHYGVRSILLERNLSTTQWPKMDLTNTRSMEILRRLGLASALREQGVPSHFPLPGLFSSGLAAHEPITRWNLPSVDEFQRHILANNDGTQPLEPYQRISQVIFEKWLKDICDKDPLIDVRFGCAVKAVDEERDKVSVTVENTQKGNTVIITADYLIGCDGASSQTRKSMGFALDGGPIPACALLVHFKSRDLARIQKQGQFWHIYLLAPPGQFGGVIIAQDEIDTWTAHLFLPPDGDASQIDSRDAVYRLLGGLGPAYEIEIDEILVRSVWRLNLSVARTWTGSHCRVFIAGDAAHQTIPTGGYGMNTGIGDAYDMGWKLAAVINGQAGQELLRSYEQERKPVAARNVEHSGEHFRVHGELTALFKDDTILQIDQDTQPARALKRAIHEYYAEHDGENKDAGFELDYRYKSSVLVVDDENDCTAPAWTRTHYTPSTYPGHRAPHIFLSDGSALYDHFGKHWTLLRFVDEGSVSRDLLEAAEKQGVPVVEVDLAAEPLAKKLYERKLVLVRPDMHVAWRGDAVDAADADRILQTVTGKGRD